MLFSKQIYGVGACNDCSVIVLLIINKLELRALVISARQQ